MKIQYDKEADALYMYLSKRKIVRTTQINDNVIMDFDAKGRIVGIEMLDASIQISKKSLKKSFQKNVLVGV